MSTKSICSGRSSTKGLAQLHLMKNLLLALTEVEDILREKLNLIKTGLMQDLLTGRVRVKIDQRDSMEEQI